MIKPEDAFDIINKDYPDTGNDLLYRVRSALQRGAGDEGIFLTHEVSINFPRWPTNSEMMELQREADKAGWQYATIINNGDGSVVISLVEEAAEFYSDDFSSFEDAKQSMSNKLLEKIIIRMLERASDISRRSQIELLEDYGLEIDWTSSVIKMKDRK